MKGKERRFGKCMDLGRGCRLLWSSVAVGLILLTVCGGGGVEGQTTTDVFFRFYETPPSVTSNTTATFRWGVVEANGSNPCAVDQCVNQCKLDDGPFMNCSSQTAVYTNLADGDHVFTVLVSTTRGYFYPNETSWTIDTIPPTAVLNAGPAFTNAVNITVNVKFSESCISPGFLCPNASQCDAYVSGPGTIIPSTLVEISFGLEYTFIVALSTVVDTGKVSIRMDRSTPPICFDAAGNGFVRNASSVVIVRFGRSIPTVNMWIPTEDQQVEVKNEYKTVSATSSSDDLILFVDFSEPITWSVPLNETLQIDQGGLVQTHRGGLRNRRFGFLIVNVSDTAIISISLPGNSTFNKYGTYIVQTTNITFLYDSVAPAVSLSTTSLAKTKNHLIPFLIQFTEPVFVFGAQNVAIAGGNLTSFVEVSKSTYTLEVYIFDDAAITVSVPGNVTSDISGNANEPSNSLRIKHYTEPAFAVALYSFTTAGLIATALASGALSISSATLAAAGVLTSQTSGSITADPSRNLLGMATHLQVFALSDWLATSLPVEYRETTRGLRWLIPHINPPWQKQHNSSLLNNPLLKQTVDQNSPVLKLAALERRRLLAPDDCSVGNSGVNVLDESSRPRCKGWQPINGLPSCAHSKTRRKLGTNMTLYGPAFLPNDYATYFEVGSSNVQLRDLFHQEDYTGWRDFDRNMFWIGAVGGGLILLHILLLLFLKLRTKTSVRGALTIPRFELFLLILAIPGMCQASAFIIRGGTTLGIIIGVLLLAVPAAFLLSVVLFLVVAIFMGSLVQYKEMVSSQQQQSGEVEPGSSWSNKLVGLLAGPKTVARWVRQDGLAPAFLPRYGLFFEDRKGPPKLITIDGDIGGSFPKWTDSGSNGVGRMRAVNSDDETEEVPVPAIKSVMGGARAAYIAVDISRRIALGVIFGAFARSDKSWIQVSIAAGFTLLQLLHLAIFKPFIKRGVQLAETVSLFCETGLFLIALVLLGIGHPSDDHLGLGIGLLALLLLSFVSQLVNEWYALMKQLLRLSPAQEPSVKVGMKMLGRGLVLPLIPRRHWGRFISPHHPSPPHQQQQPRMGLVPVVPMSPERSDLQQQADPEMLSQARRSSTSVHTGSPLFAVGPEPAIPGYDPGSPAFIDPRNAVMEEAVVSGEIKADSSTSASAAAAAAAAHSSAVPWHQEQALGNNGSNNWGNHWSRTRSMEGKKSTSGAKTDPKSDEMKMLRDIARASFPRWRKHEGLSDPGLDISSPVPSNVGGGGVGGGGGGLGGRKLSSSAPSRVGGGGVGGERGYHTDDQSHSDNSSDDADDGGDGHYRARRRPPQTVGESSRIDVVGGGPPSLGFTPHSSSSFEKGSRESGPLETTLSGGSLPLRELIQER